MGHTFICNQFSCGIWKFVGLKNTKTRKPSKINTVAPNKRFVKKSFSVGLKYLACKVNVM